MSFGIAKIGDKVKGYCEGDYDSWEVVGSSCDKDGCSSIYGWVTRHESGTFTGEIISGSPITFENGKGIARVGDKVKINKSYSHGYHHDAIRTTGTITTGSVILFDQGQGVAYIGCGISGSGFKGTIKSGSSKIFVSK